MVLRRLIRNPRFQEEVENQLRNPGEDNDIMPGLVPIGDTGLYRTPDEPADPTDCARYPDSPFCGGNPFTLEPIDVDLEIINDGCNIGVRATPAIAFIRLPPVALVYRKPECREKLVNTPTEKINTDYHCISFECKTGIEITYSGTAYPVYYDPDVIKNNPFERAIPFEEDGSGFAGIPTFLRRTVFVALQQPSTKICFKKVGGSLIYLYQLPSVYINGKFEAVFINDNRAQKPFFRQLYSVQTIQPVLNSPNSLVTREFEFQYIWAEDFKIESITCVSNKLPPPPPKEICCMPQCCPPPNNDLLKVLIKKVNKLSEIVGVEEYPATLPESLISKDEGFLGNLIPNPDKKIPNLTQLLGWYIERFDEVMGQFEIPIEVKDSDPTTPGDQPLGMKLPNVAESIAEMMGLLLQSTINTESLISLTTRTLIESGQDKQQNYMNYMLLQALVDYLGFNFKENKVKLPMAFTPGKEKLEELLKETAIDIAVPEFDEKFNFQTDLIRLKEAASIIKSVYFEKVNPFGDTKQEIIDKLKAARDLAKKINKDSDQEFEKFTSDAEIGFTNTTGITDSTSPYGYPYANRPKIRDISPSDSNPST